MSEFHDALDEARAADPPDDYLEAEAENRRLRHLQQVHEGSECDCPPVTVEFSEVAPF